MPYRDDIPLSLARAAHSGTSHSPEVRAEQVRADYSASLTIARARLDKAAGEPSLADEAFARYRDGYAARVKAWLAAQSRIVSVLVCGPSGYPAERMHKRNRAADKRREELIAWSKAALDRAARDLAAVRDGLGTREGVILAERRELDEAIALQARMKAANAAIRKSGTDEDKIARLATIGIGRALAITLLAPGQIGGMGFASFQLTNNNAKIKRLTARVAELESREAAAVAAAVAPAGPVTVTIGGESVESRENHEDDRLELHFSGRPDPEIIGRLKRSGWKWSPRKGCWQRQLTNNARAALGHLCD